MENLNEGLMLMVVGMTTVFVILFVVIYLGKGLIALVNKFVPEEVLEKRVNTNQPQAVDSEVIAVIAATVNTITGGKGNVANIVKL